VVQVVQAGASSAPLAPPRHTLPPFMPRHAVFATFFFVFHAHAYRFTVTSPLRRLPPSLSSAKMPYADLSLELRYALLFPEHRYRSSSDFS